MNVELNHHSLPLRSGQIIDENPYIAAFDIMAVLISVQAASSVPLNVHRH